MAKTIGTNIDDKKKLNMDALGDSKLTDEQIKDLQKRYDVKNIAESHRRLLDVLVQLKRKKL